MIHKLSNGIKIYFNTLVHCILCLYSSGTEEEYSELTQLLQDIADYQRDLQDAQLKEREAKKLKEVNDKTVAEEMRKSAMETLTRKYYGLYI